VYDDASFERLVNEGAEAPKHDSDERFPFQRDRDRIIYSTAFRRIAGKTQVVAVEEYGLYHTRLTHSLKVAQLGRRLGERLQAKFRIEHPDIARPGVPDPDLIEAACLAHDLGHPPFGHVGETTLGKAFDALATREAQPRHLISRLLSNPERVAEGRGGFEGNAQTFRILAYLSARVPLEPRCGLNLTRATLDACSKYPWLRNQGPPDKRDKWGAFPMDTARLAWVRAGVPDQRRQTQCFEAQVMDWCDDVTYAVHDMLDFYRGGFIPLERIFAPRGARHQRRPNRFTELIIDEVVAQEKYTFNEVMEAWVSLVPRVEIFEPWGPGRGVRALTQRVTSVLITYLVEGVSWRGQAPCRHLGDFVLHADSDEARRRRVACDFLKHLLWKFVIKKPEFQVQQRGQEQIVGSLLGIYSSSTDLLPPDRLEDLDDHGDKLRAATDHVASLTEQDAHTLYERLTGYRLGSLTDVLAT
jgi:dGTPase